MLSVECPWSSSIGSRQENGTLRGFCDVASPFQKGGEADPESDEASHVSPFWASGPPNQRTTSNTEIDPGRYGRANQGLLFH